jgi:hypothetical protein
LHDRMVTNRQRHAAGDGRTGPAVERQAA